MKQMIIFTLASMAVILAVLNVSAEQAKQPTGNLSIHITGFDNTNGVARVAIVNSKETYESDTQFMGFNYKIINNEVKQTISLPYGEYAVKLFHDENSNDELDTKMFGIPSERYGFSNDARGTFGPPDYEDARFTVESPEKTITIHIQ